jgi:glutamate/tyrosine decarboxylase-like PLP-dependent enzyme
MERADSLAFDFHKWLHVNYSAGCVLIRDGEAHRYSFADRPEYLRGASAGLASGGHWPVDYGPELSRGFMALKIWTQLKQYGTERLGAAITRNCEQAAYLAEKIGQTPELELLARVALNIVCYRFRAAEGDLDALNEQIVIAMQESGVAVPSTTRLGGALAIRVNLTNHRTRNSDLDLLLAETLRLGTELSGKDRSG